MPILCWSTATLAIAMMFYIWRNSNEARIRRERVLRERVAYLLWSAANHAA